ncbi:hypothetical protein [Janthinobacterium sp. PC23-8]|uniref:hypothetical protein n=1 Tax=Janthinobacterium sp. PC23-8 TaxID=2012679 RepID=UPI000B965ECB|nr:hypothetical protein [Janthinobacterium sp. PC23-8]OYO29194.1 hypothetical protein CD932_19055 [Janthinobacterium sp. PC23-8]
MNPRIYKKQAKRAVQLLRSFGDKTKYAPSSEPGVIDMPMRWPRQQWLKRANPARYQLWNRISSIPEWHQCGWDGDAEGGDARVDWVSHYGYARLPEGFFDGPEWDNGGKPWPRMTTSQRMGMWRFSQIAPGWRWRGGRAVQVAS